VTQDQWQDTLSDAAETDEYDPARKIHMHFVIAHNVFPILFRALLAWMMDERLVAGPRQPTRRAINCSSFNQF
jgi:hypothetical protein